MSRLDPGARSGQSALIAVLAIVFAGCGCTLVGCFNVVSFSAAALSDWVGSDTYDLEVCLDDDCYRLSVDNWSEDTVSVSIASDDIPPEAHVRVTATAGDVSVEATGNVTFDISRPNGRFCDPTCGSAELEIDGNEVGNA